MKLKEQIIHITKVEDIPTIEEIESTSRGLKLKYLFENDLETKRDVIGNEWKDKLTKFSIGLHINGKEINVLKLITDEEIEEHQLFFESCAIEYGLLAEKLIKQFVEEYNIEYYQDFPLKTLNPQGVHCSQGGEILDWKYFFHGFHCMFIHNETKQQIEVPLTYGEEYGELDPYFYSIFIRTTPEFQPLPVQIYDNFHDGLRILDTMLKLGKFEKINSNLKGRNGIIVKKRIKKEVKVFENGTAEAYLPKA